MKKQEPIVIAPTKPGKARRGHQPHRTGAGVHNDKRTARCRTRQAQFRRACE